MFDFDAPANLLENKNILITGASDGIGKCCATTFAKHGANVVLLGRSLEKLESVYDEIEAINPGKVIIQPVNFSSMHETDYQGLVKSLAENFDCLDGLILNAGMLGLRVPIEFYPSDIWQETINVNVNSVFHLLKASLPLLKLSKDARVLFISSGVGRKAVSYTHLTLPTKA